MATSHSGLKRIYNRLNLVYFDNELPDIEVVWEPTGDSMGLTHFWKATPRRLTFDPSLKGYRKIVKLIMLHEMIHVKHPRSGHGPKFKAERQRLWDAGAFDRLV